MACEACPFAGTDQSEYVQGLGCLPSGYDIIQMKKRSGHNWSCHESKPGELKLCAGMAETVHELEIPVDIKSGGLISYETWERLGEEAAIAEADHRFASA